MLPRTSATAAIAALMIFVSPLTASAGDAQHFQRSYDLEATRKIAGALAALGKVSAKGKRTYVYQLRKGWLLYINGRHPGAIQAYHQAVKLAAGSVEARLGLTLPQMALLRFKDAAATAHSVLKIDADNYLATSRLAYCSYNLGRYAESMRRYQRLIQLYPADVEMRVGLGWAQLKLGKKREAAKTFSAVVAVAPNHAMARQGLAFAQ